VIDPRAVGMGGEDQRRRTLSRSFPMVLRFQSLEVERTRKMLTSVHCSYISIGSLQHKLQRSALAAGQNRRSVCLCGLVGCPVSTVVGFDHFWPPGRRASQSSSQGTNVNSLLKNGPQFSQNKLYNMLIGSLYVIPLFCSLYHEYLKPAKKLPS